MPDPTGRISHLPDMHRGFAWKEPCRAATTANITIATALNNGDTLDGVTLATGDRVLVKDQSTGSQNGIYIVGASPGRAFDMDQDATTSVPASEVLGAVIHVWAGTVNGGTLWRNTNTSVPVLGTTALTFVQIPSTAYSLTISEEGVALATAATSLDFVGAGVVASGTTAAKTITVAGVTEAAVRDVGRWEVMMTDGIASPPEPMTTEDGTDWLYAWIPG